MTITTNIEKVNLQEYISLLAKISEPTRLQILLLLTQRQGLNQKQIIEALDISTQAKASRHLGYLHRDGILEKRRANRTEVIYSIHPDYQPILTHIFEPVL